MSAPNAHDRPAGRVVAAYAVYGAFAGTFVFAIEAVDRLRVLRQNLFGTGEAARLVLLLAATIVLVAVASALAGLVWTAADSLRGAVARRLPNAVGRWRAALALVASAAVVTLGLRVVFWAFPFVVENLALRTIRRIDRRLVPLGVVAAHPKVVYTIGLAIATVALVALHAWLFSARGRRAWLAAFAAALGFGLLVVGGFAADSRVEFTRYEYMFHVPLEFLYGLAALAACVAAGRAIGDPVRVATSRAAVVAASLCGALGLSSLVFGAVAMDSDQNVKALFWNRSIVARRAFQAARAATDRDGDGFSPYFGGGDVDDADAGVNPMAAETPANGVDDNCIGGDLARSDQARGSLFVPVSAEAARAPEPPPAAPAKPAGVRNILILSVDCLRGDHLSCYGYPKQTSPNIDRFAAESLVFENAYAQGTNTGHSFTSLYRSSYADDIFDSRIPTFAKVARDRGFQTHFVNAIRTDAWLNANRWDKYKELMGDFEIVHSEGDRFWNAEALTDRAIETIDGEPRDVPQLTWVHYFDCHRPRRRHPEHDFGRSAAGVFDSNVAFVDRHMGRLLDHLRESGRLDDTIVFIIADHGEAFMEHGAVDHSNKPYNNNTLVPLIVHAPGAAPARFSEPCGLIDVGPTALAFAGIPSPAYYRGVDLLAAARAGGPPHRLIVSETPRNLIESSFYSWALVDWPLKVMWDVRSNTTEIYDIEVDPEEQHNLVDRHPELATRLRAELGAWLDRETARTGAVGPGDEGLDDGDGD